MKPIVVFKPKNKIRIVTAASLFDGHDAAINIMRRIIQASGAEVIHLGHDRSVKEIVDCAIQEDVQAIAITSYQGGHMEFFRYMFDLLKEADCSHIKIFGGGGGTILPSEIDELQRYGITRIYSPDDGRSMGLQGMINDMLQQCDFPSGTNLKDEVKSLAKRDVKAIASIISAAENFPEEAKLILKQVEEIALSTKVPVLGITGTGGAGKSSLIDELVRRFLIDFPNKNIAIVSVDPSKRKTGGALLGDRIRMNAIANDRVYMRSLATRQSNLALSKYVQEAVNVVKAAGYDLIILETSGIGQSDTEILDHSDVSLYVMTPEYGAATQLEKIDMLDFADVVALNKFDKRGAQDALRDVKKQYKRNRQLFDLPDDKTPVFGTIASQFNDPGMNSLYIAVMDKITEKTGTAFTTHIGHTDEMSEKIFIIPPARVRYLSEISENNRGYDNWTNEQAEIANQLYALFTAIKTVSHVIPNQVLKPEEAMEEILRSAKHDRQDVLKVMRAEFDRLRKSLAAANWDIIQGWPAKAKLYKDEFYSFKVRDKVIKIKTHTESLSHTQIPKVATPRYQAWGDVLRWVLQENVPGEFPYAAGVYPFKRTEEDPARMFAGEGGPERTNKRFHYVSTGLPAKRLSTAFDSVTLYGRDPDLRPDIYGKVGNSGVSICCLDDAKKLYSGFNLASPTTSVSMTINGPAPTLTAFFMNAAIDQQCELYIKANGLEKEVEKKIADIYKAKGVKRPEYQSPSPTLPKGKGEKLGYKTADASLYNLLKDFAEENKSNSTAAEAILWAQLKGNALEKYHFRRQHIIGRYIADFVCLKKKLVIEVDGLIHQLPENKENDEIRTQWLKEFGFTVIRFTNDEIVGNIDGVLTKIGNSLKALPSGEELQAAQGDNFAHGGLKVLPIGEDLGGAAVLPTGNEGLGLMLLGVTGDQVLPKDVYEKIKIETLKQVRGTVQADILKEDQAQNTCIFSTEFSLRVMGDVQQYFIENNVRNFYSVSISGYHIAEAGANPITQLAFTLSNGFTYVEYYLSRGMKIDDFAPNLSFFFSNGIDPEYAVIGRVARKIWAKAMKLKYKGNERSQMLKYHIQTSGRSLHAQEIDFNDIRTTLQALYAIYDNCNSLHTNAYDEAITTPTEESVRRAMAIQLIINKELGLSKNENPIQGSFIIEELTDLVEEAVLSEFDKITERGGVLGAMETMYQRGKIQEESLYYETLKHTGEFPIIGVNTYLSSKGSPTILPKEVIRATEEEKQYQISMLSELHKGNAAQTQELLRELQLASIRNENIFEKLMEAAKYCSLGQITEALFEVGGQYRRNM